MGEIELNVKQAQDIIQFQYFQCFVLTIEIDSVLGYVNKCPDM